MFCPFVGDWSHAEDFMITENQTCLQMVCDAKYVTLISSN